MIAAWPPRPADTCRSTALKQVLALPSTNQRPAGVVSVSSIRVGSEYQSIPFAASAQNTSRSSSERRNTFSYMPCITVLPGLRPEHGIAPWHELREGVSAGIAATIEDAASRRTKAVSGRSSAPCHVSAAEARPYPGASARHPTRSCARPPPRSGTPAPEHRRRKPKIEVVGGVNCGIANLHRIIRECRERLIQRRPTRRRFTREDSSRWRSRSAQSETGSPSP